MNIFLHNALKKTILFHKISLFIIKWSCNCRRPAMHPNSRHGVEILEEDMKRKKRAKKEKKAKKAKKKAKKAKKRRSSSDSGSEEDEEEEKKKKKKSRFAVDQTGQDLISIDQ